MPLVAPWTTYATICHSPINPLPELKQPSDLYILHLISDRQVMMVYGKSDCKYCEWHFSQRCTMISPRHSSTGGHLRSRLPGHAPSLSRRAFLQSLSQSRAQRVIPNRVAHQFFKTEGAPASSPSAQAAHAPL